MILGMHIYALVGWPDWSKSTFAHFCHLMLNSLQARTHSADLSSADSRIPNMMFNRGCRPTVTELVLELVDSAVETTDSSAGLAKIGVWVWALRGYAPLYKEQ